MDKLEVFNLNNTCYFPYPFPSFPLPDISNKDVMQSRSVVAADLDGVVGVDLRQLSRTRHTEVETSRKVEAERCEYRLCRIQDHRK